MDDAAWDKLFVAGAKTPYNAEDVVRTRRAGICLGLAWRRGRARVSSF